jgi:uncharacterized iron-regulated membrane protein
MGGDLKPMSFRKILFRIHLGIGCLAGVVVFIMSATGVLLAYERQIIHFLDRGLRSAQPSANAAPAALKRATGRGVARRIAGNDPGNGGIDSAILCTITANAR